MKVAVCISGQPRNYKKGFLEIKKWFLDKYDCDVYIHTWYDTKSIFETGHDYLEKKSFKNASRILRIEKQNMKTMILLILLANASVLTQIEREINLSRKNMKAYQLATS